MYDCPELIIVLFDNCISQGPLLWKHSPISHLKSKLERLFKSKVQKITQAALINTLTHANPGKHDDSVHND